MVFASSAALVNRPKKVWLLLAMFISCMFVFQLFYKNSLNPSSPPLGYTSAFCPSNAAPNGKRAGIVYLVKQGRTEELIKSLRLLFKNFNSRFQYPVILFHQDTEFIDVNAIIAECLASDRLIWNQKMLKDLLLTRPISFYYPDGLDLNAAREMSKSYNKPFPGYNHMISFWWKWIFDHYLIREFDYFMRLDSDSYIESPIEYDIFEVMRERGIKYGYRAQFHDLPFVTVGMLQFLSDFVKKYSIELPSHYQVPLQSEWNDGVPIFYNNFEIVDIKAYTAHPTIRQFTRDIWHSHHIYDRRWGDAGLRYMAINMAFNSSEMHEFCDFDYWHDLHFPKTCQPSH